MLRDLHAAHMAYCDAVSKLIRRMELEQPAPKKRDVPDVERERRRAQMHYMHAEKRAKLLDLQAPAIPLPVPPRERPTTTTETEDRQSGAVNVVADFMQVHTWAKQRGMIFVDWDDLPAINRKRDELGLPVFARKFPTKGIRG